MIDDVAAVKAVWPDAEVFDPARTRHRWMVVLPWGVSMFDALGHGDTKAGAWKDAAAQAARESLRRARGHGAKVGGRIAPQEEAASGHR